MQKFRFHVVNLPHTEVTKEFLPCAYTQKTLNFCKMMKSLGHEVYLYAGGEKTDAPCDEFVSCISKEQQSKYFGGTDWRKDMFPIEWDENLPYWKEMNTNAIAEIEKRFQPKDFVCIIGGTCHTPIIKAFNGRALPVEFGVGYKGIIAPFRVFESYAWMHHVYGMQNPPIENGVAFDTVIPNYFDLEDFPDPKDVVPEDYYLYIGRMITRKGAFIAVEATGKKGAKLKMAGQGVLKVEGNKYSTLEFDYYGDHIEYLGTVGVKQRYDLMSKAKAVFVLTQYIGPFEGVQVEANLCGTPVITTDWGCFTENVIDGMNGFRTRTMGEILYAMENVNKLDRKKIREFAAKNFSMDRVKHQYQAYFEQLYTLWDKGWHSEDYNPTNERYKKFLTQ